MNKMIERDFLTKNQQTQTKQNKTKKKREAKMGTMTPTRLNQKSFHLMEENPINKFYN